VRDDPCEAFLTDEDDAISREAVHDLIATWVDDCLMDDTREVLETIDGKIEDMPSIHPQVGSWIEEDTQSEVKSAVCSICGKVNLLYGRYCKWCGAEMVESEEK
jgi:hypothetical protein